MKTAILVGYFVDLDEAQEAFRKLRRQGYLRAAWVSKSAEGEIHTGNPFLWRQIFGATGAFILFGALAAGVLQIIQGPGPIFNQLHTNLIPAMACGLIGTLLSLVWIQPSRFGIERRLLEDHARWLVAGETVLILQTPIERLRLPVNILLESGEIPPAVFVLHPQRQSPDPAHEERSPGGGPLTPAQLQEHARRLATDHQLAHQPLRNTELLGRLERVRRWTAQVCLDLSEAAHLQQSVPPTAEWLLDNEYILESNARDVRLNLPWAYYRQLPALAGQTDRNLPRIYGLARELAANTELLLDEENILAFIEAYQSVRAALNRRTLGRPPDVAPGADRRDWAARQGGTDRAARAGTCRFLGQPAHYGQPARSQPAFSVMAQLTETHPSPSPYFASQLIDTLYDEGVALAAVKGWLERTFNKTLNDLLLWVKNLQTKDQIAIGNAFTSLRQLALLDWKECFERLSRVELTLRQDPSGIYPQMDFATRDRYRRAIEDLRRGSGLGEEQIAQHAVDLSNQDTEGGPDSAADERLTHVGTYLIGEKRGDLTRLIGCRESLRFRSLHWAYRHHTEVYILGLSFFSAAIILLALRLGMHGSDLGIQLIIAMLLLIPASQLSLEVMNTLITRLFPPRALPKMNFKVSGIPDACRTLVVVPMMLVDQETIKGEAEKLEIRYLANKETNLLFALYSDYKDAAQEHCDADAALLQTAKECIEALNERHGGERFFLLHRERKWCESEQKFIGWERKRGKLEELNDLIVGTRPRDAERLVYVGDPDRLSDVRFVITLDSDTQLPVGTARRMIETLAHPLNRARLDGAGRVRSGYTIIQPSVNPSLPSTSGSPFSRLFSDPIGIDPYTSMVSDAYQDLAGEGSYHGKGIYDVRSFSRVLSGRFPEAWLLSHDLIEGAHVRVGLASDIELYDEFPQDYLSYIKREHRWIRGDWQIADWIMPHVPRPGGGRGPNPLTWFDRWKVFDNLRRSLLPAASLALLMAAWLISSRSGLIASVVVAMQLLFHSLVQPFTWATTRQGLKGVSLAKVAHDLLRVVVQAALLPYQAWLALDAMVRVWYRRTVSHRGLLEWTSAQATHGSAQAKVPMFLLSMGLASVFSVLVGWAIAFGRPTNLGMASPWLALWFLSPLIGWLLNRRPPMMPPQDQLPEEDRQFLRHVARRTWRYFTDFVNEKTSWLPPDNYQVSHQNQLAMRTSPTNIGLYLVSVLSAHDFGYLSVDEVAQNLSRTLETIRKLDRHEGHLLNWYDIQTLAPLNPRYVSTVDSGNLLGALWTLDRGLESLMRAPLLDARAFAGLHDAGEVLRQVVREDRFSGLDAQVLDDLRRVWETPTGLDH